MTGAPCLVVDDLDIKRSGSTIVSGVHLEVHPGEVSVVLGANGAGKTTLLEAISGVIPVANGTISLDGADITKLARDKRVRAGLAHIEQGRSVFADLTVEENLTVPGKRDKWEPVLARFPELASRRTARAGLLSGGEQQMLVVARALVNEPRVLMLDEMSLGLAPLIVQRLLGIVAELAERGTGILLVEQFASLALSMGDRAYVLSRGGVAYDGDCESLATDPDLLHEIYLGGASSSNGQ